MNIFDAAVSRRKAPGRAIKKDATRAAQMQLASELTEIMTRAHAIGLHKTGHALHEAVRAIGYEIAEQIQKEGGQR